MTTQWLDKRIKELGKTKAGLARAMGAVPAAINKIVTGDRKIQAEEVPIIAAYLEWPPEIVLGLISGKGNMPKVLSSTASGLSKVRVIGAVQAGKFNPAVDWPYEQQYEISPPIAMPQEHRFMQGFEIIGPSMNQLYPEGSVVVVVPTIELGAGWTPKSGQRVLVQRVARFGGLDEYETTVKEVVIRGDEILLTARSDHPEFKNQPPWKISLPNGSEAGEEDLSDKVRITGLVVGSWRSEPDV